MPNFGLNELVEAVHGAVLSAADIGEQQAFARIKEEHHWTPAKDDDGEAILDKNGYPVYRPKMITLRVPTWVDGKQVHTDIEVPLATLTTNRQLFLKELKLKMGVRLDGLDDAEVDKEGYLLAPRTVRVNTGSGWSRSGNLAELEITFSGEEASEGDLKINQQLVKLLP
tara:strand:- start:1202 stop:1708 length:507 start_codon:yes stop_codon:yes gene_type:complete